MKRFFLQAIGFFCFAPLVFANDMSLGGSGGSPYPVKQTQVAMQSERIVIRGSKLSGQYKDRSWRVRCHYVFKNLTGKRLSLRVGFPYSVIHKGYLAATPPGYEHEEGKSLLYGFVTRVNGKRVATTAVKLSPELSVEKELDYSHAYVFPLVLRPFAAVKVDHRYVTGVTHFPNDTLGAHYILRTGRLWRGGVIQHAVFEVIPGVKSRLCGEFEKQPHVNIQPKPKGMVIVGKGKQRIYRWDLKDFVPKQDLNICIQTAQSYIHNTYVLYLTAPDEFKPGLVWQYTPAKLRFILNAIYAQYGKSFHDQAVQAEFKRQWWYSRNPHYSDERLTDQDKKAIDWLRKRLKRLRSSSES